MKQKVGLCFSMFSHQQFERPRKEVGEKQGFFGNLGGKLGARPFGGLVWSKIRGERGI